MTAFLRTAIRWISQSACLTLPICPTRSGAKNGGSEGSARQSTIHHQLDRVDVGRIVRGKKKHSLGQIFRLAPTSKRNRGREEVGNFCGFLCRGTGACAALPDGSLRCSPGPPRS